MSSTTKTLVVISILIGTSLAALDSTIIGMTQPTRISPLAGSSVFSWAFFAYLLASTIAIPVFGRLADLYGRKAVYLFGTLLFLIGSVLCIPAQNLEQLILFRALQGLGAAAIIPTTITIIADIFSAERAARVQGLFGAVWGTAGILGPALGVQVMEVYGWNWLFLANIPLGLLSAVVVGLTLRERGDYAAKKPAIDYWGGGTFAIGITILLLTLLEAGANNEWSSLEVVGMLAISASILGLFVLIECTVKEPMLPLSFLLGNKTIRSCSIAGLLMGMAMLGVISYVPLFLQGVIDGVAASGTSLIPLGLGWAAGSAVVGYVVFRLGYRSSSLIGATIIFVGSAMLITLDAASSQTIAVMAMGAMGLGLGFSTTSLLIAVQNSVDWDRQGLATSSVQFFRTMGGIIGVSVLGMLLNNQMAGSIVTHLGSAPVDRALSFTSIQGLLDPALGSSLDIATYLTTKDALAAAMHSVFWGILGFAILALIASLFLPGKEPSTKVAEKPQVEES